MHLWHHSRPSAGAAADHPELCVQAADHSLSTNTHTRTIGSILCLSMTSIVARPPTKSRALELTDTDVIDILTCDPMASLDELAKRYNVSRHSIQLIFLGERYGHVAPDIPRRQPSERRRTCWNCIHCRGTTRYDRTDKWSTWVPRGCDLNIPEQQTLHAKAGCLCNWHQPEGQPPAFMRELVDE
jgi:hypothetical protein